MHLLQLYGNEAMVLQMTPIVIGGLIKIFQIKYSSLMFFMVSKVYD